MTEAATTAETATTEESIEEIGARIFAEDAPPVDPAAPAVEPAIEPAKADPAAERVSARIIANQRAEARAAKQRADVAAERAAAKAERDEYAADIALAKALREAKDSPSKVLELLGTAPKGFLEKMANEHEPEEVAKRAVAGTMTEVQQLKKDIADLKAERDAERRQLIEERSNLEHQAAGTGFLEFVATNAEKYPNLVEEMTPAEIVNAGFRILNENIGTKENPVRRVDAYIAEHGHPPDDDEIAAYLEAQAQPRAKARSEWRARIGKNAPAAHQGTPSVDVRATQMDRGPSPRTLTSRAASEKAAAAPVWSQEAADEESLRILRAAMSRS